MFVRCGLTATYSDFINVCVSERVNWTGALINEFHHCWDVCGVVVCVCVCVWERNGLRPRAPVTPSSPDCTLQISQSISLSGRLSLTDGPQTSQLEPGTKDEKWAVWLIWCPQPWDYLQNHTRERRFPTPLNPARVSFHRIVRERWETCLETDIVVRDGELYI